MTDARFPERWLNDRRIMRLSPRDFRSYVLALTYAVANRTDGRLDLADLEACPGFNLDSIAPLVSAGLWLELDAGVWAIVGFVETQTTRAQLDALALAREKDKQRKAAERARRALESKPAASEPVRSDVRRDVTEESSRTGQDRTGQALGSEHPRTSDDDERGQHPSSLDESSSSSRPPDDDDAEQVRATLGAAGWGDAPVRRPPDARRDDEGAAVHYLPPPEIPPANPGGMGWQFHPDSY